MRDCEFIKECPALEGEDLQKLKAVRMCMYCQGPKMRFCKIRELLFEEKPIPPGLKPSGELE